ncbi:MAG: hypothetical protein H0Z29_03405 [Candidatus Marinimicrobia bacterium]|nr:hypothetical protein [Candidatus Neomarinimicrobiota bacterium]
MKVYELSISKQVDSAQKINEKKTENIQKQMENKKNLCFQDVLKTKVEGLNGLKFSAHAIKRLEERNIDLNSDEIRRLREGVNMVGEKGARNSLILMGNRAFIVSVKNKVIVTALTEERLKGNVFTNIDSVAVV